jgi:dynein heavy chain
VHELTFFAALTHNHIQSVGKFNGLVNSIETNLPEWRAWYRAGTPETEPLPGEWDTACNDLQKMIVLRCLRPDRVSLVATSFIVNNLGQRFVEPPPLDMNQVLQDASPHMPLVFVLSAGVDPARNLIDLAKRKGMGERIKILSLGQGQAPIAER